MPLACWLAGRALAPNQTASGWVGWSVKNIWKQNRRLGGRKDEKRKDKRVLWGGGPSRPSERFTIVFAFLAMPFFAQPVHTHTSSITNTYTLVSQPSPSLLSFCAMTSTRPKERKEKKERGRGRSHKRGRAHARHPPPPLVPLTNRSTYVTRSEEAPVLLSEVSDRAREPKQARHPLPPSPRLSFSLFLVFSFVFFCLSRCDHGSKKKIRRKSFRSNDVP